MSNTSPDRALTTSLSRSDTASFDVSRDLYHLVGDIEVTITAELGRRLITLHELLRLRIDDVLVFSRPLGEHVDLLAGNVMIGAAEILATEEKLAVRLPTSSIPPRPRIARIQSPNTGGQFVWSRKLAPDAA